MIRTKNGEYGYVRDRALEPQPTVQVLQQMYDFYAFCSIH